MKSSLTTLTLFPITNDAKGWEQLGETATRTIFKQHIGGATEKKDQREWSDCRPISPLGFETAMISNDCELTVCRLCAGIKDRPDVHPVTR
jgi:hypothetical protein